MLQPIGLVGELLIGGIGVSAGYLNNPELTAEKFDHDLWNLPDYHDKKKSNQKLLRGVRLGGQVSRFLEKSPPGRRRQTIYKTGDLTRWLPQGEIEFLGRIDYQLKVRGFRIDLVEVEEQLLTYKNIKEAVVMPFDSETDGGYLCAYVVLSSPELSESSDFLSVERLREHLSRRLPDYMIPSYVMYLEQMPLTPNGKLDRQALPPPEAKSDTAYTAPRNKTEEKITQLWSEILGIEKNKIGIDDNFFGLGGHSLRATLLVAKIHRELGIRIPLVEIFKSPNIRQLAEFIKTMEITPYIEKHENLVLLRKTSSNAKHLFFVHDGSGEVEVYEVFCQCLDEQLDLNCWGIKADMLKNNTPQNFTINEIAAKYLREIKKIQPQGSYFLVGWCLGGTIAFELTRQLEQMGEKIAFFALIDSPSPLDCRKENVPMFTLESEKNFIKKYLWNREIEDKLENITNINEFWPAIAAYLEAEHLDAEIIRKIIQEYEAHIVPNYHQLGVEELVKYLNVGRTLSNARASYVPTGKVNIPGYFFKASQSKFKRRNWNSYFKKPLKFYEITGDHYSIMQIPQLISMVNICCHIIKDILQRIS
jgi:thioesterase domain-containing protein/acyl carrier protein